MLQYAITDRRMFPGDGSQQTSALIGQALRLSSAGVDLLQIREKDLPEGDLEDLARRLLDTIRAARSSLPRVLLSGPARVAAAVHAHGLHLRTGSTPADIRRVRETFAAAALPPPLLSLSCHSLKDVRAAAPLGLDLLLLGPIFEKRVHGTLIAPGLGLDLLRQASLIPTPAKLIALGGITPANTPACLEAGAAGIAGIRLFL